METCDFDDPDNKSKELSQNQLTRVEKIEF